MAKKAQEEGLMQDQSDELESIVDFSEDIADAEKPDPLPIGEYPGVIVEATKKYGKESGRPYANIRVQIGRDAMPADYVEKWQKEQVNLTAMQFICEDTPQGRYNARRFCEAVGARMGKRLDLNELKGLDVKVAVNHDKDLNGDPVERVQRFLPV